MRFSSGGCVANSVLMLPFTLAGTMKKAFRFSACAQVLLGHLLHLVRDPNERGGQSARPAGDDRGAAVGGELAVARQGEHQEERDHVDEQRH